MLAHLYYQMCIFAKFQEKLAYLLQLWALREVQVGAKLSYVAAFEAILEFFRNILSHLGGILSNLGFVCANLESILGHLSYISGNVTGSLTHLGH